MILINYFFETQLSHLILIFITKQTVSKHYYFLIIYNSEYIFYRYLCPYYNILTQVYYCRRERKIYKHYLKKLML